MNEDAISERLRERVMRMNPNHDDACEAYNRPCRCHHRHRTAALDLLVRWERARGAVMGSPAHRLNGPCQRCDAEAALKLIREEIEGEVAHATN